MKNKLFLATLLSLVFLFAFASIDNCKIKTCAAAETPKKIIEAAEECAASPCENFYPFNLLIKI